MSAEADNRSQSGDEGATVRPRGILSNSAWNYTGAGFGLVATLVTTPIYLHALGLERFGLFAVLLAILSPMGVLNAGVTQGTVKFIATFSEQKNHTAVRECVVAGLLINMAVGLFGAVACIIAAPCFLNLGFKIAPELAGEAQVALRLMGLQWFVTQVASTFRGVFEGLRDQRKVVIGDTIGTVLTAILCSVAAVITGKLSWLIAGQVAAGILLAIYWLVQARTAVRGFQMASRISSQRIGQVYGYSRWQVLNAAAAILANVGDRYFIGIFLSAATLGAYNVALRAQSVGRTLFYSVNQALFPAASAVSTQPGASELLVVTVTWHVSLMAGIGLGAMTVCGPSFLHLWVGPEIAGSTGLALRLLLLTLLLEIPSATGASYLNAHGLTRLSMFNNVITTILTIGLMVPLGLLYGVNGVAASGLIGLGLSRAPFHFWMHKAFFSNHVDRRHFLHAFYGVSVFNFLAAMITWPIFDAIFSHVGGFSGFMYATVVTGPIFLCIVLLSVIHILKDAERLTELSVAIAARRLPVLSRGFTRLISWVSPQ